MLPVVHHEAYEVDIGPHVFPTAKYRLVRSRLIEDGLLAARDIHRPDPAPDRDVLRVHTAEWVRKLKEGDLSARERLLLEVPYSPELVDASWLCAGGACLTARLALRHGTAVHLGGGFHHAFPDHGEGFCAVNDVAVAIRERQAAGALRRAAVVDLDVHHGNGTAAIFAGDPAVFTFSMHQERNYPAIKPPSDLDVGLPDGIGDDDYLALLEARLPEVLEGHRPELVCYLAGADAYREDQLGGLGLSREGLRRRDERVLRSCRALDVPVAVCLAGGYAFRTADTVDIHVATVREAGNALGSVRPASAADAPKSPTSPPRRSSRR